MNKLLACGLPWAALVLAGCERTSTAPLLRPSYDAGGGQGLNLRPGGFGKLSYAAWKAGQGEPDITGNANQALYFQKMTTTATFAAGVAVISGLEGQPVSALTNLSWEHRNDGWCGAGAPRWDVFVTGSSGASYTVFLGCAAATHTAGSTGGWTKDSYGALDISSAISVVVGSDVPATISGLIIVFDEGTDEVGNPGFVFLDNITVNSKVWTSPADNSN
jgi:hypothetical protein